MSRHGRCSFFLFLLNANWKSPKENQYLQRRDVPCKVEVLVKTYGDFCATEFPHPGGVTQRRVAENKPITTQIYELKHNKQCQIKIARKVSKKIFSSCRSFLRLGVAQSIKINSGGSIPRWLDLSPSDILGENWNFEQILLRIYLQDTFTLNYSGTHIRESVKIKFGDDMSRWLDLSPSDILGWKLVGSARVPSLYLSHLQY